MTTARSIIRGALSFHLNALSPGEVEDADLFNRALEALNAVLDEINGGQAMLWRQVLTAGTVSGVSGTIGTTWATLPIGTQILGATYSDGSQDVPIAPITMAQYHAIPIKITSGQPQYFAQDGGVTVYFYPAPASTSITLRSMASVSDFSDFDTDYQMPTGYKSALQALVSEKLAPSILGDIPDAVARAARKARLRLKTQIEPEIIGGTRVGNILTGWR